MKTSMDMLAKVNEERKLAYDLLRVYVGVALFARGIMFVVDKQTLIEFSALQDGVMWKVLVMHYVMPAHFVGGAMLAMGVFTRLAALSQLPILLAAVFFVHLDEGLMAAGQGLEVAALTAFLLLIFAVFGPGHLSLDAHFFPKQVESIHEAQHAHP